MLSTTAPHRVQVAIIGAGVVGLAIARALSSKQMEVLVLERHSMFGSETSSRNSEVIHAGLYYPQNSWKAQFCVQGKQSLYNYCQERNVPYHNCGKLIVATNEQQWKQDLPRLYQQAIQNGVTDVELVSEETVQLWEPNIVCVGGALWSPSTGVLDSHSYMTQLLADAEDTGNCCLVKCSNVKGGRVALNGKDPTIVLQVDDNDDDFELHCNYVINCAGLQASHIAQQIHSADQWVPPRQYFAKGNYFRLQGSSSPPFRRLIYPLPEPGGLGVHATIDWMGTSTKFGPNVEWLRPDLVLDKENTNELYTVSEELIPQFEREIRKYWPDLPPNSLVPDYAGIRPKLHHPSLSSSSSQDFQIAGPKQHGVNGLYHLFGIESPGLTSSMAIAEHIAQQIT